EFVVGQPASYTLVVTNGGSAATTADATVTDTLPAGVTIDAAPGCSVAGQVVACTVPSGLSHVAPGNTASFTIDVTPTAAAANPVLNSASVVGGGDPACAVEGDCSDSTSTPLVSNPALRVSKQAVLDDTNGNGRGDPGERITYSVGVENTGDVELAGLVVLDSL